MESTVWILVVSFVLLLAMNVPIAVCIAASAPKALDMLATRLFRPPWSI